MILNSSGITLKNHHPRLVTLIPRAAALAMTAQQLMHRVGLAGQCSDAADDTWFPTEPENDAERAAFEDYAREICSGCPVIAECRELTNRIERRPGVQAHGVAGGLAPWERSTPALTAVAS